MRFHNKRWAGAAAAAATLALVLTACGGGSQPAGQSGSAGGGQSGSGATGGTLTAAVAYETKNYSPTNAGSALANGTNLHVMEGLYNLDMVTFQPYKALAADDEPTKVSDTVYEIALRKDAKFSDGTPVTAKDVVESFKRNTEEGALYAPMLSFIEKVEAKDDTTVTITLKFKTNVFKARLSLVRVLPASMTEDQAKAKPIGSGPWMYESIDEQMIHFVPNPHYNGDHPAKAEKMEYSIIKDDTARTTAMQEGTVQVMENVPADVVPQLEAAGATVEKVQGFNLPFLMFNTAQKPFDNAKVRQAFLYAIDTEKLIANAMGGNAAPATSFLPETHPNYHKAKNVFTHDPAKAKALLAEAGVANLKLTLATTDHPWIAALAPQIQNDLKAVGIEAEIKSLASSALYDDIDGDKRTLNDVFLAPGDPSTFGQDPDLLMSWWYGDNKWTNARNHWKETAPEAYAKLHAAMDAALQADGDAQQAKWNEAFDIISDEVPLYPLFHRQVLTGYMADQLDGFKPISTTGLSFIDVNTK
ncbi:ABC transporter substrate-binding protein [Schaalia sp. 19OD2882]|uniref:ABC transporter substrate-binding protein n=1 Tax=Schaalia sp. 19OD2882 TaxID=2794089 RepID=UPI001C1EF354|nr:ABC transporter substrate-binding protein [Schaalia sp. 19OD2882]QWW18772.1 ABC transporter substrate-binding protein [Schaalia sp. 19OD2882]